MKTFLRSIRRQFRTTRQPAIRPRLNVIPLEDRITPTLFVQYNGLGTNFTLGEFGSTGSDTVTVSEPVAGSLRVDLGSATFASFSSLNSWLAYEVAKSPTASNYVDVNIAAVNAINQLTIDLGAGFDALTLGVNNGVGGLGGISVTDSVGSDTVISLNTTVIHSVSGIAISGGPIRVAPGAIVAANSGPLTLSGTGTSARPIGLEVNAATVTGQSITLSGIGSDAISTGSHGVLLTAGASITSESGPVQVTGQGGGIPSSFSGTNFGTFLDKGATITGLGTAAITVAGTGGAGHGNFHHGVYLVNSSKITTSFGSLHVTGKGGGTGSAANNNGVQVQNKSAISSNASGNIHITGTGGTTQGNGNFGVYVLNAAVSTLVGGLEITGTGGGLAGSSFNFGVVVDANGQIDAPATLGTFAIHGQGGNTAGTTNHGVYIVNVGARIVSNGRDLDLLGIGGGAGGDGITLENGGLLDIEGALLLTGTGIAASGNAGIRVTGDSRITAGNASTALNLGLDPESTITVALSPDRAAATGYEYLHVDGTVNLGVEKLQGTTAGTIPDATQFRLLANDGGTDGNGAFASADQVIFNGRRFHLNYSGGDDNDVVATAAELPVITSITSTSANGTYITGQSINITVSFSEPVELADGHLHLTLDSGAVVTFAPFFSTSAIATYVVAAGQTSPDLTVTALTLDAMALIGSAFGLVPLLLPASNLGVNAAIIVNPMAPTTVTSLIVNAGAEQRSRLTQIQVSFSSPVDVALLGSIALTRTTGTIVNASNGLIVSPAAGTTTNITLSFANASTAGIDNGSLADGRWRLSIPGLNYFSTLNDPNLRRVFGDADGNSTVDAADFAEFGNAFGLTALSPFDFDANGTVDAADFAQFGNRFGLTL